MRIVHIVNTFSNLSETFLFDLINTQRELGNECHVCTFNRVNSEARPFPSEYIHKLKRSKWDYRRYVNYLKTLISSQPQVTANWNLYRKQLKGLLERINPQVIHAHFGDMGVLIEPVAQELEIPLVVTFHGYDISILPRDYYWFENYQKLFETSSAVIGVSNYLCKKLERNGAKPEKIAMIHNGIDIDNFAPRPVEDQDNAKFTFTFIGRFVEKKSPVLLLKSYQYFLQKFGPQDVELRMVGDGPLLEKSKNYVRENKLERFVNFLGFVDHKRIPSVLNSSNAYVQHSITAENGDEEGMGVTLAEASATGIPVIVTDHNGFPDVILDNKTGYLVPEGDYEEMGEKMHELFQNPQLCTQMGKKGRKHIENNFEKTKQIKKVIRLYESI